MKGFLLLLLCPFVDEVNDVITNGKTAISRLYIWQAACDNKRKIRT
jgi:hypothetical protein